jgi:hypothetical protein
MPDATVPLPEDLIDAVSKKELQGVVFVGDQNRAGVSMVGIHKMPTVTFGNPRGAYSSTFARAMVTRASAGVGSARLSTHRFVGALWHRLSFRPPTSK